MSQTTQCPSCQTRFKVNDTQLAAARGLVRCGRCAHVFNAPEHFVQAELAQPASAAIPASTPPATVPVAPPSPPPAPEKDEADDFELELPAHFDPETAQLPEEAPAAPVPAAVDEPKEDDAALFQRALAEAMQHRHASAPLGNPFDEEPAVARNAPPAAPEEPLPEPEVFARRREPAPEPEAAPQDTRREPKLEEKAEPPAPLREEAPREDEHAADDAEPAKRGKPAVRILLLALSLLGLLVLAGQLVYFNRTRIAAEVPEMRPALETACSAFGCKVPWPADIALIRTEWSELAFVPDQPSLIQLSATLKNHAQYQQAYPMLEVTLKDSEDQVLIRKVFTPKEYLKPDDFKLGRFNASSEAKITMRLDAGKIHAMGYSLYWFYP